MRKIFTVVLMWLTTIVFGQGIQLSVGIQDGCGNAFPHEATLELYKILNGDTSLVEAVSTHPAVFNGLEKNVKYTVKVSTETAAIQDPTLVDVLSLRNVILGFENYSLANILAGDYNGSGGLSTLDIVNMSREIIKLTDNSMGDWFFIEQSKALIKTWGTEIKDYINQAPFQASADGSYEILLNAYQYGHVAATLPSNCVSCEPVAGSVAHIVVPNIALEKGKKYTVPVKYEIQPKDAGTAFALKYEHIEVTNVGRLNADIHHSASNKTIYSLYAFYNLDEDQELVMYTLDFTALEDGSMLDFIHLDNNFANEALNNATPCFRPYSSVELIAEDSCRVSWPPAEITIKACYNQQSTGIPFTMGSCNQVAFSYLDEVTEINQVCKKIVRTWTAFYGLTGDQENFVQNILVEEDYPTVCFSPVTVLVPGIGATVYARDFLEEGELGHSYAFSLIPGDSIRVLTLNQQIDSIQFVIYDLQDSTKCITQVNMISSGCNDPVFYHRGREIEAINNVYTLSAALFDAGNTNHCLGEIDQFEIRALGTLDYVSQLTYDYNAVVGQVKPFELRVRINGETTYLGVVAVRFKEGSGIPPFELACYDDVLTRDEAFEIAIFSPNFENVYGFQGAIRIKDAILLSTKKVSLSEIAFNDELYASRFIWVNPVGMPQNFGDEDTLWTIKILPIKNGSVSDFLSIGDDLLNSEAILNDLNNTKIDLVFKFYKRTSATHDLTNMDKIQISPNPAGGSQVWIDSKGSEIKSVTVYDLSGRKVIEHTGIDEKNYWLSIESISTGLYHISVATETGVVAKRLVVAR
ncbi:MAG: T9SS type A sorting domain-containing protein [Saprospiraceae bacterium]|nr:T9SS type A sorting domain-containing protein [Saprospiraceae bacterium]